ncbi:MAG TPA: response regulator [Terriglobales bacterium]|nr:response regulator [Terriglobales bacterium]
MNQNNAELVEIFLQEAAERLQFLREYCGILLDASPSREDVERLYISAHSLAGTSASYGFPLFSEVAGKLAHVFQYAMNASIGADAVATLVEFISESVALLETDLTVISDTGTEPEEDFATLKQRYSFAFPAQPGPEAELPAVLPEPALVENSATAYSAPLPETAAEPEPLPQDDDVPAEILEFFVPEAEEHLQIVTSCLLALESGNSPEQIHQLFRSMHTVKGSAAQVGLHRISHIAHAAEELIGRMRDGELEPSAAIIDVCLESVDVLKKFIYRTWTDDAEIRSGVSALLAKISRITQSATVPVSQLESVAEEPQEQFPIAAPVELSPEEEALLAEYARAREIASGDAAPAATPVEAAPPPTSEGPVRLQPKSVRVPMERLERMMNAVGELVINRTRMLGRLSELEHLAEVLNLSKTRMHDKVSEFQEKHEFSRIHSTMFRSSPGDGFSGAPFGGFGSSHDPLLAEFSELEMDRYDDFNILSRSLMEISADLTEVLSQLEGFARRVNSEIEGFTKVAHRLQDEIAGARMVPIANLYTRLSRTVRDAAKAAGKRVEISFVGAETELDSNIVQQISDPLIHLVRNAVAHGIESEEERYQSGKNDSGRLTVTARHQGNHILVEVEDDGRGIDYNAVRRTAAESGLIYAEQAPNLSDAELLDLLFQPGFSTATRKTELAGRGVGLDVVRSNLAQLNGEIEVSTALGKGTRFTLKVPLTLIISQAVFVRCGKSIFAVPVTAVEEIRRVRGQELIHNEGKLRTRVRDAEIDVVRLDLTLGLEPVLPVNGFYRMVVVRAQGRQVGIVVEDIVRKDEIVIKGLGGYLEKVKMFPGATIAPDGSLVLVIDVNRLVAIEAMEHAPAGTVANAARIFAPGAEAVAQNSIPKAASEPVEKEKVIILVDDSISVRKFVGRMLEKGGYRVKLAADGLEALEIIAQIPCDLVITDLEMPRTNGYELLAHLRNDPQTRATPVMVVTSRAGIKHRERAMKEGASAFLTKPVQEEQFLAAVGRLIGVSAVEAEVVQ